MLVITFCAAKILHFFEIYKFFYIFFLQIAYFVPQIDGRPRPPLAPPPRTENPEPITLALAVGRWPLAVGVGARTENRYFGVGRWGPQKLSMRFWGRAEASVARRFSVAVSTIATRLLNARDNRNCTQKNSVKFLKRKKEAKKEK